jgi:tetratricopeptide (TPR) repeat protein
MQIRACAPGVPDEQIHRDAFLLTAQTLGLPVAELEARIAAWAGETADDLEATSYDKALAMWLQGESGPAVERAMHGAREAAARASAAASAAAQAGNPAASGAAPGEDMTTAARTSLLKAKEAASEERRAWLLIGHIEYGRGRLHEALSACRRAMAAAMSEGNPLTWVEAASHVAWILDEQRNYCEAEPLLRSILRVMERTLGPGSPEAAAALNNLGRLLRDTGRFDQAEILYRRALTISENACGANHPQVAICLNNLAGLLRATRRPADAEPLLRRALEIDEATYGRDHPSIALGLNNLGSLLHQMERWEEAEQCFREALAIDENAIAPDSTTVATDLENLAIVLRTLRRHSEAEPLLRRSIDLAKETHGMRHHRVAFGLTHLSMLLTDMDRHREAGALARQAVKLAMGFARNEGRPPPGTRFVGEAYLRMLKRLGIPDEEVHSIIFMIQSEIEREAGAPAGSPSAMWMEAVLEEMGIVPDSV